MVRLIHIFSTNAFTSLHGNACRWCVCFDLAVQCAVGIEGRPGHSTPAFTHIDVRWVHTHTHTTELLQIMKLILFLQAFWKTVTKQLPYFTRTVQLYVHLDSFSSLCSCLLVTTVQSGVCGVCVGFCFVLFLHCHLFTVHCTSSWSQTLE